MNFLGQNRSRQHRQRLEGVSVHRTASHVRAHRLHPSERVLGVAPAVQATPRNAHRRRSTVAVPGRFERLELRAAPNLLLVDAPIPVGVTRVRAHRRHRVEVEARASTSARARGRGQRRDAALGLKVRPGTSGRVRATRRVWRRHGTRDTRSLFDGFYGREHDGLAVRTDEQIGVPHELLPGLIARVETLVYLRLGDLLAHLVHVELRLHLAPLHEHLLQDRPRHVHRAPQVGVARGAQVQLAQQRERARVSAQEPRGVQGNQPHQHDVYPHHRIALVQISRGGPHELAVQPGSQLLRVASLPDELLLLAREVPARVVYGHQHDDHDEGDRDEELDAKLTHADERERVDPSRGDEVLVGDAKDVGHPSEDGVGPRAVGARDRRWAMRLRMGKSGDGETGSGAVGRRGGARASEQRGDDEKSCHRRPVVRSTGSPGPHQVPEPSSAEEDG